MLITIKKLLIVMSISIWAIREGTIVVDFIHDLVEVIHQPAKLTISNT